MTEKQAIHILIKHAASDCVGGSCGIGHAVPSFGETLLVSRAILKVWPEKHYAPNWFNLNIPDPNDYE